MKLSDTLSNEVLRLRTRCILYNRKIGLAIGFIEGMAIRFPEAKKEFDRVLDELIS